jgi:hypothetical protein
MLLILCPFLVKMEKLHYETLPAIFAWIIARYAFAQLIPCFAHPCSHHRRRSCGFAGGAAPERSGHSRAGV